MSGRSCCDWRGGTRHGPFAASTANSPGPASPWRRLRSGRSLRAPGSTRRRAGTDGCPDGTARSTGGQARPGVAGLVSAGENRSMSRSRRFPLTWRHVMNAKQDIVFKRAAAPRHTPVASSRPSARPGRVRSRQLVLHRAGGRLHGKRPESMQHETLDLAGQPEGGTCPPEPVNLAEFRIRRMQSSADSPTSTTSLPDCPQNTRNRVSEPPGHGRPDVLIRPTGAGKDPMNRQIYLSRNFPKK